MEKKPLTHVEMSRLGGIARAAKLTKERRSAIAKKASKARWKKARAYPAAVILLLLSLASPLSAQEKDPTVVFPGTIKWTPIVFFAAGQMADGATTTYKISRGCGESNVGVYTEQPSSRRVLLVKGVTTGAIALNMAIWQKMGHPKIAKWFGIVGGAVGFGAAGYNLTVNCGGAR